MAVFNGINEVVQNPETKAFTVWCYFGHAKYDELCVECHFDKCHTLVIDRMTATSVNGAHDYTRFPKNIVADFKQAFCCEYLVHHSFLTPDEWEI